MFICACAKLTCSKFTNVSGPFKKHISVSGGQGCENNSYSMKLIEEWTLNVFKIKVHFNSSAVIKQQLYAGLKYINLKLLVEFLFYSNVVRFHYFYNIVCVF